MRTESRLQHCPPAADGSALMPRTCGQQVAPLALFVILSRRTRFCCQWHYSAIWLRTLSVHRQVANLRAAERASGFICDTAATPAFMLRLALQRAPSGEDDAP